jgi:6-phosphofructokinase 1
MSGFFSYTKANVAVVRHVGRLVSVSLDGVFIYQDHQRADTTFIERIMTQLAASESLIVFLDEQLGVYQDEEIRTFRNWIVNGKTLVRPDGSKAKRKIAFICLKPISDKLFEPGAKLANCAQDCRILYDSIQAASDEETAKKIAQQLTIALNLQWRSDDDLPLDPHMFSYEKDIITFFHEVKRLFGDGPIDPELAKLSDDPEQRTKDMEAANEVQRKWLNGCPVEWPETARIDDTTAGNHLKEAEIGKYRPFDARVTVKALREKPQFNAEQYALLEAGPREKLVFPHKFAQTLKVGILVSGGIAPGVNAVIDGIVQRHWQYAKDHYRLDVRGLRDGFLAFDSSDESSQPVAADPEHARGSGVVQTRDHAHEGGSILGTSRVDNLLASVDRGELLEHVDDELCHKKLDILYIIGGDGTMKAAHALYTIHQNRHPDKPLSVVAIPKTMDNDVLWVWQSFGFLSAVEKAREVIEHLSTEVESNPRLCVVQLFGSDSGFVVSHAVLATTTGHSLAALIPEEGFSMEALMEHLRKAVRLDNRPPRGIVVMAETAIPSDAQLYVAANNNPKSPYYVGLSTEEIEQINHFEEMRCKGQRIQGQTNDSLRSAGLKIVSRGLQNRLGKDEAGKPLPGWEHFRVFTNEPRHLLRAIPPSCLDIIIGQRLGTLAVDNALAGYTDFMISQWLTEYVLVPLKLVILGRKRIPRSGIFWKSVLAKTGQPSDMEHARVPDNESKAA